MQQRRHGTGALLIIAVLTWAISARAEPVRAEGPDRSQETVARAEALQLWTRPDWLRLVHYRPGVFGGMHSQVDGAGFFLSERGQDDPRAELIATLFALYRPAKRSDLHARCRFPARFHWLDRELGLSDHLPRLRCPGFERFAARTAPERVSLIYAANSVESPVSAFGHTFLRFHRAAFDLGIEYTAETDTHNPLWYAFKGLVGMFRGRFHYHVLGDKLSDYLDGEARDVWEYELVLSPDELGQLTRHLWELSATYFDYYYMTENCSYGVLALLEAAAPRLDPTDRTKYVVLPVDTLKALYETPGLVRSVEYRPARSARMTPAPASQIPWYKAPHTGHGTMRVALGTGFTSQGDDGFATLGYRIALHDLADPPQGQPALLQIQFMDVRARYEIQRRRLTLNELTFAELVALHPLGKRVLPSWRARGYGQRLRDAGCRNDDCFAHGLDGSLGLGLGTSNERVSLFLMADAYVLFSAQLDGIDGSFVRAGLGPYGGIRVHGPAQLVSLLTGSWSYLPDQNLRTSYELRAVVRGGLATDVALGVEALVQPSATELQLLSYLYF